MREFRDATKAKTIHSLFETSFFFLSIRESRRSQWQQKVSKGLFCQGREAPPSAVRTLDKTILSKHTLAIAIDAALRPAPI
jgi:hypothetical protein